MPPVTVAVNRLKITNALENFTGFGFRVNLLIRVFVLTCSRCCEIPIKNKQLLVEGYSRVDQSARWLVRVIVYPRVVQ